MARIDPTGAEWRTEKPEGLCCCIRSTALKLRESGESGQEPGRE